MRWCLLLRKRGFSKLLHWLRHNPSKRAELVSASNDVSAFGVMRETFDFGLRIPQDLSLVGFGDIRLAQFMIPPLTTVQMSQTELATLAFNALMNEVKRETPTAKGTEYVLTTNLVLRNSTALAAAQQAPSLHPQPASRPSEG